MLKNANILLVFSSLCFLFPSLLSFYKAHYIHSVLSFQSSIISTMYWSNTKNEQMLFYDRISARLSVIYWILFSSVQKHVYGKYICTLWLTSLLCYIKSSELTKLKSPPYYWAWIHFLFHMSTAASGCILFLY
jgi:hypothetical protein